MDDTISDRIAASRILQEAMEADDMAAYQAWISTVTVGGKYSWEDYTFALPILAVWVAAEKLRDEQG